MQAIRWASDRLNQPDSDTTRPGVIAFVHPNSLSNATSLGRMRATPARVTDIYVVKPVGDAIDSQRKEGKKNGQVIFGIEIREKSEVRKGTGSRIGVQITVLVRNPDKPLGQPATLHYAEVPERSTLKQKFDWLADLGDATSDQFETVPVNDTHDWINLTDGTFHDMMPVCITGSQQGAPAIVSKHASGVKTNCDQYVYSFSKEALGERVRHLIDAYNDAAEYLAAGFSLDECTENSDLPRIKWTETLKQSLRKNEELVFDKSRIREVLYRPFTKLWLYEDPLVLSRVKTISALFPLVTYRPDPTRPDPTRPDPTRFCLAAPNNRAIFSALATNAIPDLSANGTNQPTRAIPRRRRS